jgi:secreted Zn-dependent insulinase-like peptidase
MPMRAKLFLTAVTLAFAAGAGAQSNFATGNMHFNALEIDANGDHMISKDEFMQFGEKMWGMMSNGAPTISIHDAAQDFARGNMRFSAKMMDADHDGTISKEEFMSYGERKFDKMSKNGMMTTGDATKYFSRGNLHSDSK